jgi:hypothetical protein
MARASESEQIGSVGVSEVTGKFGRIGFGFAEIARHELGRPDEVVVIMGHGPESSSRWTTAHTMGVSTAAIAMLAKARSASPGDDDRRPVLSCLGAIGRVS